MIKDVQIIIPDPAFSGLAVIDLESWRPIWGRNFDKKIYQEKSIDKVKKEHPEWSQDKVLDEAEKEFETGAR